MAQLVGAEGTASTDGTADPGVERGSVLRRPGRVLDVLLRRHPDAVVGAVTADASARLVPVPASVAIRPDQPRFEGESMTSLLEPADRRHVPRLWMAARTVGLGGAVVHFESSADPVGLYFLDFREDHGVLLVVAVVGADELDAELSRADEWRPSARFSRVVKDPIATVVEVDEGFERMLGWSADEVVGQRSLTFIHPDDQDKAIEHWMQMLALDGPGRPVRLRHRHRDGRWIWVEITNHNRLDHVGHVVADMVDVSDEVAALDAVLARQQLLEQVTEALQIGVLHADIGGRLLFANPRFSEITGLVAGDSLAAWAAVTGPGYRAVLDAALAAAAAGRPFDGQVEMVAVDGGIRHIAVRVLPLVDSVGSITGITGSVEDVTGEVLERRNLERRAATDSLTGCLNRSATLAVAQDSLERLGAPSSRRSRRRGGVAVVFVDVDNLKRTNDRLGHAAGDALLVEVAERIRHALRANDTVGRFGGDEFVVVLANIANEEHAMTVAHWIAARISKRCVIDGQEVELRASLGVAWTATPGIQATWLIRRADAAMYVSKRQGRGEPVLAEPSPA